MKENMREGKEEEAEVAEEIGGRGTEERHDAVGHYCTWWSNDSLTKQQSRNDIHIPLGKACILLKYQGFNANAIINQYRALGTFRKWAYLDGVIFITKTM